MSDIALGAVGTGQGQDVTMTDYSKGILLVGNNVGNRNAVTFTVSFTADANYSLTELKLAFLTFNGQGHNHTAQPVFRWSVSLNDSEIGAVAHQATTTTSVGQRVETAPVYNFDANAITLGSGAIVTLNSLNVNLRQGETYTLHIDVSDDLDSSFTDGYFVGLGGFSMKGTDWVPEETDLVPEPATATLSLLALAALAARRRRR